MEEKTNTTITQAQNPGFEKLLAAEPVLAQERIEVLDVLRGFALLGILIANMAVFSSPAPFFEILGKNMWTNFWDNTTTSFINILVQGKFYSMFSFLFGLGFSIFFERAKTKTSSPIFLFYRRLFVLLLIGLAHAFFIWFGDILVIYALLGFLLPLFFNRKPKTLLIWAVSLFVGFIAIYTAIMGLMALLKMTQENFYTDSINLLTTMIESRIENSFYAYGQGTFSEIMSQRSSDYLFIIGNQLFATLFIILPLFLIGLYAGKRAIFQNIETNLSLIKKTWIWVLVIGISFSILKFICKNMIAGDPYSFYQVFFLGAGFFGDTGICLFIITSFILLIRNGKWAMRFKPLAYMGRMALSNYLFQSIVCTTIFYNYGLGLYGKVGPALGLVLAITVYTVQIFISKFWFKYFRFGPMEWVWRCLTYGKLFRMRI